MSGMVAVNNSSIAGVANLNSLVVNSYFPASGAVWITMAYVVIFVFGFFGNICIIYIVVSRKQMRTKFNFLIVNMAVGDLLVSLFVMPFEVVLSMEYLSLVPTCLCR